MPQQRNIILASKTFAAGSLDKEISTLAGAIGVKQKKLMDNRSASVTLVDRLGVHHELYVQIMHNNTTRFDARTGRSEQYSCITVVGTEEDAAAMYGARSLLGRLLQAVFPVTTETLLQRMAGAGYGVPQLSEQTRYKETFIKRAC